MADGLLIPPDPGAKPYPGGIAPGFYHINDVVALLREHKHNPEAVQFIADMLEV